MLEVHLHAEQEAEPGNATRMKNHKISYNRTRKQSEYPRYGYISKYKSKAEVKTETCIMGMVNAAVLPLPVSAQPNKSHPLRATGMAWA